MSRKVMLREEAFDDLDRSSAAISEYSPQASVRFLEEAQKAFDLSQRKGVRVRNIHAAKFDREAALFYHANNQIPTRGIGE